MASLFSAWSAHRIRRLWRREDPAGQCVVCQARVAAERRTLSALHGGPQAPPAGSRQCVRHLLRPAGQRAGHALTQDAVARAGRLIGELADASGRLASPRSRDAPFRGTRAWRRAAAFIDGAVFGGAPPRDP
jgi:hypothetical protein